MSEKRLQRTLKTSNPDGPLAEHQRLEYATTSTPRAWTFFKSSSDYCAAHAYPSSTLVKCLDVSRCTTSIKDKYFDRKKGKGLVTKVPISGGQVVWKEDPLGIAPEW